jgi:hypothetical protein
VVAHALRLWIVCGDVGVGRLVAAVTLREWIDKRPSTYLDGVVLKIPKRHRTPGMAAVMAIKSGWGMSGGRCGLWLIAPGHTNGQVFPVTGINVEDDLMKWEIVP